MKTDWNKARTTDEQATYESLCPISKLVIGKTTGDIDVGIKLRLWIQARREISSHIWEDVNEN